MSSFPSTSTSAPLLSPLPSTHTLPPTALYTAYNSFQDSDGRRILLRGVNLSGASKAPIGEPSQNHEGFWESAKEGGRSFVGRPFVLDDNDDDDDNEEGGEGSADVHLRRLKGWGFNFLRFPVTWESLEHEGPRKYDYEYMDYIIRVLKKCKQYGFKVFIDPHQDVWSRFTGGSGAPYWTLPACGLNPHNFTPTQAALLHSEYHHPDPSKFPAMIWSTNYNRLVSQTLFTLFFSGRDFAPMCIIDGVNIQDWLQGHFIDAFGELAGRIKTNAPELYDDVIVGWDSMNEPSEGLCGYADVRMHSNVYSNTLTKGTKPTVIEGMRLGVGMKQTVENWSFGQWGPKKEKMVEVDPEGRSVWGLSEGEEEDEETGVNRRWGWKRDQAWKVGTCIWALHGVWDPSLSSSSSSSSTTDDPNTDVLLPSYFASPPSSPERMVSFITDYWRPHFLLYATRIRSIHPSAILFIQPPPFVQPPPIDEDFLKGRACYAPHYYDGLTLITRHWNWFNADALGLLRGKYSSMLGALRIGEYAIRKSLSEQLAMLARDAEVIGSTAYPTLIGEIGVPFDFDGKKAYYGKEKERGDYREQQKALDASLNACDGGAGLNFTIWNYAVEGGWEWGDGWNLEDLGLWCAEDEVRDRERALLGSSSFGGPTMGYPPTYNARSGAASRSDAALLKNSGTANPISKPPGPGVGGESTDTLTLGTPYATFAISAGPGVGGPLPIRSLYPSSLTLTPPLVSFDGKKVGGVGGGGGGENVYDFLTFGARAVRAFCRPYPLAVSGRVKKMSFTIQKASFELVVFPPSPPRRSPNVEEENEKEEEVMTEVYLPLVHFASDALLAKSLTFSRVRMGIRGNVPVWLEKEQLAEDGEEEEEEECESPVDTDSSPTTPIVAEQQRQRREEEGEIQEIVECSGSGSGSRRNDEGGSGGRRRRRRRSKSTSTLVSSIVAPTSTSSSLLDITVEITHGRVELDGQYLRWYYPRGSEEEEAYKMVVKRTRGAIPGYMGSGTTTKGVEGDVPSCCEMVEGLLGGEFRGGCTVM